MKKISVLCFLLMGFNSIYVCAQYSNSSHRQEENATAVKYIKAYAPRMNILYVGIENIIQITEEDVDPAKIEIKTNNGAITKKRLDEWQIIPDQVNKDCRIEIYYDNKNVRNQVFRVKELPLPEAGIGKYKNNDTIAKTLLVSLPGINVEDKLSEYDFNYTVKEFTIRYVKRKKTSCLKSYNRLFTEKQKKAFKHLSSGNMIYLEDVKVEGPDDNVYNLLPIKLIIE